MEIWRANRRQFFKQSWRLNLLSLALLVACVVGIIYSEGFGELVWAAVFGGVLTMLAVVWALGGHVSQLRWMKGVWGEQATEEELEKLGSGWHIEHDIPRARGNWDHVAISRAGVFAVETKWTSGFASVRGDELRFGRMPYSGASFRGAAAALHDLLAEATGMAPWVTAVVVIWGKFEQGLVDGDRVTFVSGARLADWLRDQPIRLSEERTQALADALRGFARA